MPRSPSVSVIIPCYRHAAVLPRLLEALEVQETSLDFEVLVVESGGDEAARLVGERFPEVEVLSHGHRLFPGAARNRGAAAAKGACLAFVDADAVPERRWLETLHGRLASSDRIIMVSGTVALPAGAGAAAQVLHWIEFSSFLPGLASGYRDILSSSQSRGPEGGVPGVRGFRREPGDGRGPDALPEDQWASGNTTIYRGVYRSLSLERCDLGKGLGPSAPPRLLERPVPNSGGGPRVVVAPSPGSQPGAAPMAAPPDHWACISQQYQGGAEVPDPAPLAGLGPVDLGAGFPSRAEGGESF